MTLVGSPAGEKSTGAPSSSGSEWNSARNEEKGKSYGCCFRSLIEVRFGSATVKPPTTPPASMLHRLLVRMVEMSRG